MLSMCYTVFKKPTYLAIALVIAILVFTLALWIPNFGLITTVLGSQTTSGATKVSFILSLYGSIATNFTAVSATYTIAIAVLFGINISLLAYYIRTVSGGIKRIKITGVAGIGGLISGVFGIGCAACGTFILTSALTLIGAGGVVTLLPFGGEEFGFLGVGLLIYSIYTLSQKINSPLVCEII